MCVAHSSGTSTWTITEFLPLLTPHRWTLSMRTRALYFLSSTFGIKLQTLLVSTQSPLFIIQRPCEATTPKPWPYPPALCPHTHFGETQGVSRGCGALESAPYHNPGIPWRWGAVRPVPREGEEPDSLHPSAGTLSPENQERRGSQARGALTAPGGGAGQQEGPHWSSQATASWDVGSGGYLAPLKKDSAHTFIIRNSLF